MEGGAGFRQGGFGVTAMKIEEAEVIFGKKMKNGSLLPFYNRMNWFIRFT